MQYVRFEGDTKYLNGFSAYDWGNSINCYDNQKIMISGGAVDISSSGSGNDVTINGKNVSLALSTIENFMLKSEGII